MNKILVLTLICVLPLFAQRTILPTRPSLLDSVIVKPEKYGLTYVDPFSGTVDEVDSGTVLIKSDRTVMKFATGNCKIMSLTANTTFNMINTVNGAQITVVVYNNSSFTVDWTCSEASILWNGGKPNQSTGGKTDIYSFIRAGGKIYGTVMQGF